MPPKKSIEVSFMTPGMEKMEKKVEDFLSLPIRECFRMLKMFLDTLKRYDMFFGEHDF